MQRGLLSDSNTLTVTNWCCNFLCGETVRSVRQTPQPFPIIVSTAHEISGWLVSMFAQAQVLLTMLWLAGADNEKVHGAPLLPGATKIEEARYKTSRSYDDTVEFYEKLFKGSGSVRLRKVIHSPQVKATSVLNSGGGGWVAVNIYEKDGETRLYFVKADAKKTDSKKSK